MAANRPIAESILSSHFVSVIILWKDNNALILVKLGIVRGAT